MTSIVCAPHPPGEGEGEGVRSLAGGHLRGEPGGSLRVGGKAEVEGFGGGGGGGFGGRGRLAARAMEVPRMNGYHRPMIHVRRQVLFDRDRLDAEGALLSHGPPVDDGGRRGAGPPGRRRPAAGRRHRTRAAAVAPPPAQPPIPPLPELQPASASSSSPPPLPAHPPPPRWKGKGHGRSLAAICGESREDRCGFGGRGGWPPCPAARDP
jgi:hypothetical protein